MRIASILEGATNRELARRRVIHWSVVLAALMAGSAPVCAAQTGVAATAAADGAELDRLVRDVCRRDVVLLGEDNHHGSGRTFELKNVLVKRLVQECGFDQVLFEGQFYEFIDFERAVAAGSATPARLADAIGGLWSTAAESQPLVAQLFEAVVAGRVRIGGIDPQVGSATGHYAIDELGGVLAGLLPAGRRATCKAAFDLHHRWGYDEAHPFDEAAKRELRDCAVAAASAQAETGTTSDAAAAMVKAYQRYVEMVLDEDRNARDLGMYELLAWYRTRQPRKTKTVVWCATVHAAKKLGDGRIPLGRLLHEAVGERMAAIGFTAVAGSFGRPPQVAVARLSTPAGDMLESKMPPAPPASIHYLDRASLAGLGVLPARVLDYTKPQAADWSEIVDGLVVLAEERPTKEIR